MPCDSGLTDKMVRPPCCEKQLSMKRAVWTEEEDAKILAFVSKHGSGNWTDVPKKAGLKRCGKSCRLRWSNYLKPDLKHDRFTPQEEELIVKLHSAIGSRWSIIAQQLPGRTDNDVKNYWNTKLKKKLSEMGIDPVTHKPFSKLLADYGNIGGLQKPSVRTGSLSKDFKNAILFKSEPCSTPPQGFRNMNSLTNQTNMSLKAEESNKNSFLSNITHTNSNSIQLQAIPMMTGSSNCIPVPIFLENCMSPTSSPSPSPLTTCSTAAQDNLALPFSWNDFLLEDAFPPVSHRQEQENNALWAAEYVTQQSEQKEKEDVESLEQVPSSALQFSSSSSSSGISFVEAMLDEEDEMFLNFPHLMEEPSNY